MRKLLSMLLVAIMCVSLVACGGEKESSTSDNNVNQDNNDSITNDSDSEAEVDYTEILLADGNYWSEFQGMPSQSIWFCEDHSCMNDFKGFRTWELTGTTVSILEDDITTSYEIKDVNGLYLLVGNNDILYNINNIDEIDILIKEVEVTVDNWQDYFEVCSYSVENVDIFGEVTDTSEVYYLKLRDEYFKVLICRSDLDAQSYTKFRYINTGSDEEDDKEMGCWYLSGDSESPYFGCSMSQPDFEVVKIQGTLYFVDME